MYHTGDIDSKVNICVQYSSIPVCLTQDIHRKANGIDKFNALHLVVH